MRTALASVGTVIGAVIAGVTLWATLIERHRYIVRESVLAVLPPGHRPVRVLHLSDLHMAPWQRRKIAWVAGLARLRPDLVVSTGDLLGHSNGIEGIRRAFEPFRDTPGVFVHGSNDYFGPQLKNPLRYLAGPSREPRSPRALDTDALTGWLQGLGWHDLNNREADIRIADTVCAFVGVDDPHLHRDDLRLASSPGPTWAAADCRIGVLHAPYRRVLDAMTDAHAELLFAGHTHGGQVRLPDRLGGALVTNCDLPRAYARGVHEWHTRTQSSWLSVSAGLGTSITAPIRLFCRPEATLVTLIPRS